MQYFDKEFLSSKEGEETLSVVIEIIKTLGPSFRLGDVFSRHQGHCNTSDVKAAINALKELSWLEETSIRGVFPQHRAFNKTLVFGTK